MSYSGNRKWMVLGVVAILLGALQILRLTWKQNNWAPVTASFSYEMPRPKNFDPGVDFGDRQIAYKYKKVPELPPQKYLPKTVTPAAPSAVATATPGKAPASVKKTTTQAKTKKPTTEVRVADTSRESTLSGFDREALKPTEGPRFPLGSPLNRPAVVGPTVNQNNSDEEEVLSPSQWRNLLQTAPTPVNTLKLVKAHQANRIDSETYFQITHELLVDTSDERRKAGFAIIDQETSASMFEYLIAETAQATGELKIQLQKRIVAYQEPAKIVTLGQVLSATQSEAVRDAALDLIELAVRDYQKNASTLSGEGPGTFRQVAGRLTPGHLRALLPSLSRLSKTPSAASASRAQTLSAEIQNLTLTRPTT